MKITPNYAYKVNFGYDKQLNKELKDELNLYPDKDWAKTISSLNNQCNRLENQIIKEEKNPKKTGSKFDDYIDMFLTLKDMLTGFVEFYFEDLHFADREYKHYNDEFIKSGSNKYNWRKDVCERLDNWSSSPVEAPPAKSNSSLSDEYNLLADIAESIADFLGDEEDIEEAPVAKTESNSLLSPKSLLEEFKADAYSPKGFADVAGMPKLKQSLTENVVEFIRDPDKAQLDLEEYGKSIPKGILLYGPPGCGKTYITQALSAEVDTPMYMLNISKAGSEYINKTSSNIKNAFDEVIKIAANTGKPCILFMDEIESLGFDRKSKTDPELLKQVSTILQSIDSAKNSNVILIGATNKYDLLDPAVRRRFDSKVFVDVPDIDSIKDLLVKNLTPLKKGQKLLSSPESIEKIAQNLQGFSNSSICNISKEAALNAMRRNRDDISVEDYEKAIRETSEEKPNSDDYRPESSSESKMKKIGFSD